jgi:Fibronectin type III domain
MPTSLSAMALSSSTIRLQWSDNSGDESGYLLNNTGLTREVGSNTTSYDWGGFSAGTNACFAVAAFNGGGYSNYYPTGSPGWVCATTPTPQGPVGPTAPAAPSGLSAAAVNGTTIHLQWTDNSSTESGFEIASSSGTSRTTGADSTQFDWTGLSPGTNMCFHLRAYNDAGGSVFSPSSATVCATTPGPPAAPTNFTVTQISASTVRLQWTDNSDNETSFLIDTGWAITSTYSGGGARSANANATSYDWNLPNGSWRCFRLSAENSHGSGSASPTWTCAPGTSYAPPATPSGGTATAISSTSIRIQWTDNANNEGAYVIGHNGPQFLNPNTTSYQADFLTPGTQYCFTVGASNLAGSSGGLGPLCATTLP